MSAPYTVTTREVFDKFLNTTQVVVVKNLPVGMKNQPVLLQNYFEVICDNSVEAFHFPCEADDIGLVVFEENAEDYEKYHAKIAKKPLLKSTAVVLSPLRNSEGLLVTDVSSDLSDELLSNYFENKRSGGSGNCVDDVRSYMTGRTGCRLVVVVIADLKVVQSILGRSLHCVANKTLNVEPYFPAFHDFIIDRLFVYSMEEDSKSQVTETRTKSEGTPAMVQYEQHSGVVSNPICCLEHRTDKDCLALPSHTAYSLPIGDRDIEAKPSSVRDTVDPVQYKNELERGGESEPDVDTLSDPRNDVASMPKKQIDDFQSSPGRGLKIFFTEQDTKIPATTKQAFQALAVLSETPFRLCDEQLTVKSPDRDFERLQKKENVPRNTGLTSERCVPHWRGDVLEYTGAPHVDTSTGGHESEVYSKPMVSDIQHVPSKSGGVDTAMFNSDLQAQPASCDSGTSFVNKDGKSYRGEGNRRRNTGKQRYKKQRAPQSTGLDNKDQEKVSLNSKQIQLLKIGAFCKKLTECTSSFNEQESCVIFSGSHDEIILGKVKMYETLGKIEECFEDMPLQTIKLLSRPECKMCIKSRLIRNKVYAVVEADLNSSRLQSSAYYRDQALKALEHVKNEISESFIKLREGQQRMLQEKVFKDLLDGLNTGLVCVYVENAESKIVIKGLMNMQVSKARQSLIDYLKSNTPRTQTKFSLYGAEARCFQVKLKTELQRKISQMKGEIQVTPTKLDPPIQVDIMVTGYTAVANATSECLKSIWHEKLDFSKISSVEKEIKLVMHGLAGSHGPTFVQGFERKMGCFIDLIQKGEYSVKPPSMETVKVSRLDSPILTDDKSGRSVLPSEKAEQFRGGIREDDTPVFCLEGEMSATALHVLDTDIYLSYQGGLSEKEALRQTLLKSQSEGGTMATEPDILDRSREVVSEVVEFDGGLQRPSIYHGYNSLEEPDVEYAPAYRVNRPPPDRRSRTHPHSRFLHPRSSEAVSEVVEFDNGLQRPSIYGYNSPEEPDVEYSPAFRVNRPPVSPPAPTTRKPSHAHQTSSCSFKVQQTTITLQRGAIAGHTADVLVNVLPPNGDITKESIISKAFVEAGGPQLIQNFKQQMLTPDSQELITCITPSSGRLNCSEVCHITLKKGTNHHKLVLSKVMGECFRQCEIAGYSSIGFPPLGVGRLYAYPASVVADCMFREASSVAHTKRTITQITVVAYDSETYQTFSKVLSIHKVSQGHPNMVLPPQTQPTIYRPPASIFQDPTGTQYQKAHASRTVGEHSYQRLPRKAVSPVQSALKETLVQDYARRHPSPQGQKYLSTKVLSQHKVSQGHPNMVLQPPTQPTIYRPPASIFQDPKTAPEIYSQRPERATSTGYVGHQERDKSYTTYKTPRTPKFIDSKAAPKFCLKLFAENSEMSERARNEMVMVMRKEFLDKQEIARRPNLSREDKNRIVKLLGKYHVDSIKDSGKYILMGNSASVSEVKTHILQILLDAKDYVKPAPRRRRREEFDRKSTDFMKFLAYDDITETPNYWQNYQPGNPIKNSLATLKEVFGGSKCKKVTLGQNDPEYTAIINLINSTWLNQFVGKGQDAKGLDGLSNSKIQVTYIQRIENVHLYNHYSQKRIQFFEKLHRREKLSFPTITSAPVCSGPIKTKLKQDNVLMRDMYSEINECYLFHGTKAGIVNTICNDGLDSRLGSGKAMFGAGVYGAESPTKADQYTDSKDQRIRNGLQMFLLRMILGSSYVCTDKNPHKYRKPPCTNMKCLKDDCTDPSHQPCFDSIVGDKNWLFREFVVYEKDQCYPEYLITYNRI